MGDEMDVFTQMMGMSKSQAQQKFESIMRPAHEDGLPFVLGQRAGNTADAHRLLVWARGLGKEEALLDQLYRMYNGEAKWVADHGVLVEAAERTGLDGGEAKAFLADESCGAAELQAGLKRSQKLGVSGVPAFIVNGQQMLSGAQPVDAFLRVFQQNA